MICGQTYELFNAREFMTESSKYIDYVKQCL